jgi:hypothetical protein
MWFFKSIRWWTYQVIYILGSINHGLLFWVWNEDFHRPTQDMDLLGFGFGDAVKAVQCTTKIPVFLDDMPAPELRVYPIESVIAEKFHAMVVLGKVNSRMKDFFDIIVIANTMSQKSVDLQNAIKATFDRRETFITNDMLYIFSNTFKTNSDKSLQWNAFIRKNKLIESDDFKTTVDKIQQFIEPIYLQIVCNTENNKTWNPTIWSWI